MDNETLLGPWVRRFLLEHLAAERNLARNTQRSYRDALTLLTWISHRICQSSGVVNVKCQITRE